MNCTTNNMSGLSLASYLPRDKNLLFIELLDWVGQQLFDRQYIICRDVERYKSEVETYIAYQCH